MDVTINGIRTNYLVYGEGLPAQAGKPFFILHGWGSSSERWIPVAEEIAKRGFKVIVPDLPGFGKSDALQNPWTVNDYVKWFEEFTNELKVDQFYLLGYSFGGALAVKIAVKYPQRVQKLFLVAAAIIRKKTTQKEVSAGVSKFIKLFSFLPFYKLFRKAIYKFVIRKSDYVYTEGVMKETYLKVIAEDIYFHLGFIKVPTVIIWGDKDQFTPFESAKEIHQKIKNSKLEAVSGADHYMPKKNPEILSEKILGNI